MNVLKDLWKDKPLLITVVVGVVGIVYLLYRQNGAGGGNVMIPAASAPPQGAGPGPGNGTFIEYSYYNNSPSTTTTVLPRPTMPPILPTPGPGGNGRPLPSIIDPAARGTSTAGKNDTNFWVYTVPPGQTLLSIAQFARWGNDSHKLANYRNNLQILQSAGVNTNNPLAPVPTGLKLSV